MNETEKLKRINMRQAVALHAAKHALEDVDNEACPLDPDDTSRDAIIQIPLRTLDRCMQALDNVMHALEAE